MTPLAHQVVKDLTRPVRKRRLCDHVGLLKKMDDVHCFAIDADAMEAVEGVLNRVTGAAVPTIGDVFDSRFYEIPEIFLPADKTWVEFAATNHYDKKIQQFGFLMCGQNGVSPATVYMVTHDQQGTFYSDDLGSINFADLEQSRIRTNSTLAAKYADTWELEKWKVSITPRLACILAFINTPRVIGRRQHMPHRGMQRRLTQARGGVGTFPLHAWTEIKLEVTPPRDDSDEGPAEAHLTGRRALHFCRAHLRIRNGQLERVRAHWRGDASLGIKQSRYRVTQ